MVRTRQQLTHLCKEPGGGAEEARGVLVNCRLSGDAGGVVTVGVLAGY